MQWTLRALDLGGEWLGSELRHGSRLLGAEAPVARLDGEEQVSHSFSSAMTASSNVG
jgi:hypothetical protein